MSLHTLPIHNVTVFGATGAQGSAVVEGLYNAHKYKVIAVTRDPTSEKAVALKQKFPNISLVKGNLNNEKELVEILKDSWALFGVTNFFEKEILDDHNVEVNQGKHLINAAETAKVKYVIFSSLAGTKLESNGKYNVPHFETKYEIEKYAKSKKNLKCIFYYPPFFYENFAHLASGSVRKASDGTIEFAFPMDGNAKIGMFSVHDSGKIIAKVLEDPEKWVGKDITAVAEDISINQVVTIFSKVTGKKAKFVKLRDEEFGAIAGPLTEEFLNMYRWIQEYGVLGKRNPYVARDELKVPLISLEQWMKDTKFTGPK